MLEKYEKNWWTNVLKQYTGGKVDLRILVHSHSQEGRESRDVNTGNSSYYASVFSMK